MLSSSSSSSAKIDDARDERLTIYFGVMGGESNCEFCVDKGRWIVEKLGAKELVIPTCDHLFHSDEDVDLLDYMDVHSLTYCKEDSASYSGVGIKKFEVRS